MITHYKVEVNGQLVGGSIHLCHLISEVGDNGCGPENVKYFVNDIQVAMAKSKISYESILLNYAGQKDLLVFPNGTFIVVDTINYTHYKLVEENEK